MMLYDELHFLEGIATESAVGFSEIEMTVVVNALYLCTELPLLIGEKEESPTLPVEHGIVAQGGEVEHAW